MSKKAKLLVAEKYPARWHCLKCGFEEASDDLTFAEAMDMRKVMADIRQNICPWCGRASFWLFMDYPPDIIKRQKKARPEFFSIPSLEGK